MARDIFHYAVRNALEKEGWEITHDPFTVPFGDADLYIDLGAEQLIGAEQNGRSIAVEVKVFSAVSFVNAFHQALGQFLNYRLALEEADPERQLFLAVPDSVYEKSFQRKLAKASIERYGVSHLVYDSDQEVITQWHPKP
jgi:XisH protein